MSRHDNVVHVVTWRDGRSGMWAFFTERRTAVVVCCGTSVECVRPAARRRSTDRLSLVDSFADIAAKTDDRTLTSANCKSQTCMEPPSVDLHPSSQTHLGKNTQRTVTVRYNSGEFRAAASSRGEYFRRVLD